MARSEPTSFEPTVIAAFHREGAAILAQERGLTPACRIRLVEAARALGIAEAQIEDAIRSLSQAEPIAPPSASEAHFRQRLRKDLAAGKRAIIGPTAEAKIFASADRKYGLDRSRAEEILKSVAAELGITRITASDAIDSLAAQIDQTIGHSTWLAREGWDRLRSAGAKWGLELEVVDEMIQERLVANRTEDQRHGLRSRTALYGACGAVLAAAVVIGAVAANRAMNSQGEPELPVVSRASDVSPSAMSGPPRWWDVQLSLDVAAARSRHSSLSRRLAAISVATASERAAGYEALIAEIQREAPAAEVLLAIKPIVAGCLALEPDASAFDRLVAAVSTLLPSLDGSLLATDVQIDLALWASDVIGASVTRARIAAERLNALQHWVGATIGLPTDAETLKQRAWQKQLRQQTLLTAYQQLAAAAARLPGEVADSYRLVQKRAVSMVDEQRLQDAELGFLVAVLPHAGSYWKAYERAMARCVASPEPHPALRLVEALRRCSEPELVEHLSKLLLVRSGASPASTETKDIIAAVRKALGGSSASLSLADRWQRLADEVMAMRERALSAPSGNTLEQAATMAHLTTMAVALAQGDAAVAVFDAGIEQFPTSARSVDVEKPMPSSRSAPAAALSRNEQRELAKVLDLLSKRGAAGQRDREAGWRRLGALGKEASDIPPAAAVQIAAHLVAPMESAEWTIALTSLSQAGAFHRLRLAVADLLETAHLEPEPLSQLMEALTGNPASGLTGRECRRQLMSSVLAKLPSEESEAPAATASGAMHLLGGTYRQRATLLGIASADLPAAKALGLVLEAILRKASQGGSAAQGLDHELRAARYVAASEIQHAVAVQRMLVELHAQQLASRRPERAAAARKIAVEAAARSLEARDAMSQLLQNERALLDVWMLYAPEI